MQLRTKQPIQNKRNAQKSLNASTLQEEEYNHKDMREFEASPKPGSKLTEAEKNEIKKDPKDCKERVAPRKRRESEPEN